MSNFTCQSKSFISIFFICQVSACELRPFSCYNLANDIYSQTAKTVFSHRKRKIIFTNSKNTKNNEIYGKLLKDLKERALARGDEFSFQDCESREEQIKEADQ